MYLTKWLIDNHPIRECYTRNNIKRMIHFMGSVVFEIIIKELIIRLKI